MSFHEYVFFNIEPTIHTLSDEKLAEYKIECLSEIKKFQSQNTIRIVAHATLGLKPYTRMMLWLETKEIETIQNFLNGLLHMRLGRHLSISHSLLGLTRISQYSRTNTEEKIAEEIQMEDQTKLKYLVVYPFTKTKKWYLLSYEERKNFMLGHMKVGGKFNQIEQTLLYGFGIDDPEYIVSYQMDSLYDFQTLVMELRSTEARLYTESDTPIYTCIYKPLPEVLDML